MTLAQQAIDLHGLLDEPTEAGERARGILLMIHMKDEALTAAAARRGTTVPSFFEEAIKKFIQERNLVVIGEFVIDLDYKVCARRGKIVKLTEHQFRLLAALVDPAPGRAVTRAELVTATWDIVDSSLLCHPLAMRIRRLRGALWPEGKPQKGPYIKSVHSVGYKFSLE